jgi:hypothetical protein
MTAEISGEFDPNAANTNGTGKDKIVSLILPDMATKVTGRFNQNFTNLTSVSGEGVKIIEENVFLACNNLSSVNFPVATTIGKSAFESCNNLSSANFPAATTVGSLAFQNCTNLITVDFLGEASDGQEASIGYHAFEGCTKLETVNFPAATSIDYNAFKNCELLTTASFPAAKTIKDSVFYGCTSLSSVDLRSAESFSHSVFKNTGNEPLTVTLGSPAPVLDKGMFSDVSEEKIVTVRVPDGAEGYGNIPKTYPNAETAYNNYAWGDGFRGAGLTQSGYFVTFSNRNDSITVTIESLPEPEEPAE